MKKTTRLALIVAGGVAASSSFSNPAAACSDTPYIGAVCFTASTYCPHLYIEAKGGLLPIHDYQALYSLVGTTFGGDGRTDFGIPNLRARHPVGSGVAPGLTTVGHGQYVGREAVLLAPTQMAPHTHTALFEGTHAGSSGSTKVTVSAQPGNLAVTAKLPLTASPAGGATATPAPVAGNSNYLGAVTATAANGPANYTVNFSGLYSQTDPGAGATAPVTTEVTGNAATPEFSFEVPSDGITGGNVTVGANLEPEEQVAVPLRDPAVGLTACIAVNGTYPPRQ